MKQITLTIKEFYQFTMLATFFFSYTYAGGNIIVDANQKMLEELGY